MDARDIMTTDVETVAPDDDVSEVLTRLAKADFNGFPVVDSAARSAAGRSSGRSPREDEDGELIGIVTQGDLVGLFQHRDRTLWIPIGFPPFLESLTYGIDLSWDQLDVGIDMVKNSGKPISEVMTTDVVTVGPDDDLDTILDLLADEDRDINRLPVVENGEVVGIVARQDVLRALKEEREG